MAKILRLQGVTDTLLNWRRAVRYSKADSIRDYDKVLGVQSIAEHQYASTLINTPMNIAKFILASRHNKVIITPDRASALITTVGKTIDSSIDDRDYMEELRASMDSIIAAGAAPDYSAEDFKRIDLHL